MTPPDRRKPATSPQPKGSEPAQILPYLYLGSRFTSTPEIALAHGITHIISVGCTPMQGIKSISYHRLRLEDTPDADIKVAIELAIAIINNAKSQTNKPGRVLVHCVAGISRSPSILAGYMMREEGMSLRDALGVLVRARPRVRPNEGFFKQLKEVELTIRETVSLEVDVFPTTVKERLRLLGDDATKDKDAQKPQKT